MATINIPLMRSTFFDEERTRSALAEFVRTAPRLSMGEQCAAFEQAFARYQGRRFATLVANGSLANLGLIQALLNLGRLKRGDKVGVSAVTWATNVMPLLQLELVPVPLDCDAEHLNVTSQELKKHLPELQAVFLTNVLGLCGDIDVIRSLCEEQGILLLEDNCESLGTRYGGTLLGNFGKAATFSFFVGHHLSTIEGGMIVTDDEELARMLLMVRSHGWDRNLPAEEKRALRSSAGIDDFHAKYTFYESAYNLRPTEITGFLGCLQLPMLEATIAAREANFKRFLASSARRPDLYYPLHSDHIERISSFAMPVVTRSEAIWQAAIQRCDAAGVEIRPIIAGDITAHPFWKKVAGDFNRRLTVGDFNRRRAAANCPNARIIHTRGFYLPNNPDLTEEEVQLLCSLIEVKFDQRLTKVLSLESCALS